jgi:hypothetical protein
MKPFTIALAVIVTVAASSGEAALPEGPDFAAPATAHTGNSAAQRDPANRAVVPQAAASTLTSVSINGENFLINDVITNAGGALEGLLPNSRMVQATFEDANPATVLRWKYPDGAPYDPLRQTNEFVAALPAYRTHGLLAVTVNFQGGNPVAGSPAAPQPWENTGFNADGSLKPEYLARMDQVIRALDGQGMVAILGYFYFGQDERLTDETAVRNAAWNATQWVLDQGYRNVLIEVDNEADNPAYHHAILTSSRVAELIRSVQTQSANYGRRLSVAVSLTGGRTPTSDIAQAEDFILLHGNGQTPAMITSMVASVRSLGLNKPVVFNEDSTSTANFQAATSVRASWGYFDAGLNNYVDGFQSPPTNWTIDTAEKQAFFGLLQTLAGSTPPPPPPPPPPPGPRARPPAVTISTSAAVVHRGSDALISVAISPVNPLQGTTVAYSLGGTAQLNTDYVISGSLGQIDIPAGASSSAVLVHTLPAPGTVAKRTITVTLNPGAGYRPVRPRRVKITVTNGA